MPPRSPTLEGFRAIFRRPSFGLAEIAWRWSFAAAGLLLVFSFFEYLDTLVLNKDDLLLLRSKQPILIYRAARHLFHGNAFRVVEAAVVLALALGIAWVVVASLARAATLKALLAYFREGDAPIFSASARLSRPPWVSSLPFFWAELRRGPPIPPRAAHC
jgi:hypothetical protein